MREGLSTGTCATAVATAATLMLVNNQQVSSVSVFLPDGEEVEFILEQVEFHPDRVSCCVTKDGGDDPDITHGTAICARVSWASGSERIVLKGGKGVGRVTKPGLKIPVGEAAINPVPRQMIVEHVDRLLPRDQSVEVTIYVPEGEALAKKTLNPKLGIVGGISILGTSGRVRPMSNESFKDSLLPQLEIAKAAGFKTVCLVPGGSGERVMHEKYLVPEDAICQMSNWVGFMLEHAAKYDFESVILAGHLGKLCKVAGGIFDTHSKVADARLEIIASYAGATGASTTVIREILQQTTTEAVIGILEDNDLHQVLSIIAQQAAKRAKEYVKDALEVGVMLFDFPGNLLALDPKAREIARRNGWWEN